jgi:hypothetical protein
MSRLLLLLKQPPPKPAAAPMEICVAGPIKEAKKPFKPKAKKTAKVPANSGN